MTASATSGADIQAPIGIGIDLIDSSTSRPDAPRHG